MNKSSLIQSVLVIIISLGSLIYFISTKNYEFIIYVFTFSIFAYFVIESDKRFKYPTAVTWSLMIAAVLHTVGGALYIAGTRLYDITVIPLIGEPFNILKYDQFLHFYVSLVIGIIIYSILKKYFKRENTLTTTLAIFTVLGVGAFYELIEFSTVVLFSSTGVGGYYNNLLDLLFNLLGAIAGVLIEAKSKD